jgi:anti-sigma factor RsiW
MNCKNWEERIALYAGGDLTAASKADVERHLTECAGCRILAEGIKDSLKLLRSAHQEPIAAGYYTAVRAGVLAQMAREANQRRPWRRWMWVSAWTAGLALAAVFFIRPAQKPKAHIVEMRAPEVQAALPEPKVPMSPPEPVVRPVPVPSAWPRRAVAPVRRTIGPPPLGEPLVVKLITDDPDIVIYWIADRKGDEE